MLEAMTDKIPASIFDEGFNEDNIGWCSLDNLNHLYKLARGSVYVPNNGNLKYIPLCRRTRLDLIPVENPRLEFAKVLENYKPDLKTRISPHAKIGKNVVIHEGTIIEHDVVIGDNCTIGGVGFGYEDGILIPHKGNVILKAGVHVGSNTCIDRAVIGSTFIDEETKIDNLVHIAHGCKIGKNSKIIAGAVLCGSVKVGDNVWIAPNASIRQGLTIGDNAVIGLGSVVVKNVSEGKTVKGNPAK